MEDERDDGRAAADRTRHGDDELDAARMPTRDAYAAELTVRLRRVCQHLSDEEFARLVADMAKTKLRFAAIEAASWPR